MVRYKILIILMLNLVLILVGCSGLVVEPNLSDPSAAPLIRYSEPAAMPTISNLPTTPLVAATPATSITAWSTFTYSLSYLSGVSPTITVQFPIGWNVNVVDEDYTLLTTNFEQPLDTAQNNLVSRVRFSVAEIPREDRSLFDPVISLEGQPGVDIPWYKSIAVTNAEGTMAVVADLNNEDVGFLVATYYSEPYELGIRFDTAMDKESFRLGKTYGFTETVAQRFQVFEYMVGSLQVLPPSVPPLTPTPIPNPLPQPPTASSWATATIEPFLIEYPADWQVIKRPMIPTALLSWGKFTLPPQVEEIPPNYTIYFNLWAYFNSDVDIGVPTSIEDLLPKRHLGARIILEDPQAAVYPPNENYEILWQQKVGTDNLPGIMYVWGEPNYWQMDKPTHLVAVFFYAPQNKLSLTLNVVIDQESLTIAQKQGFAEMVAQRFQLFEYMANSVRLTSPK